MNRSCVPLHCDLDFSEPIALWDEALPLGSGLTGCLIYGDGAPLKLSLDRGDLWDCRPAKEVLDEKYTYGELISLVEKRDQDGILKRFDKFYETCPTPTKIPAGKLQLIFDSPSEVHSHLSLQRAEATLRLKTAQGDATVSVFMSAKNHLGYLKVTGSCPKLELLPHDFTAPAADLDRPLPKSSTKHLGYPAPEPLSEGAVRGVLQKTSDGAFALLYASKKTEGGMETAFYVACSRDGEDWLARGIALVANALRDGYDEVILPHLAWWEAFWSKSSLRIPDAVLEKNWYLSHYFLGSCSRKGCPPMPLQGVWTADNGHLPPWKGDYHGDLNLQFSYYSCLKADHTEECESFLDFFDACNQRAGREFARTFFDAPGGSCLPSVFAFDGTSLGGWPMYATNITNQIWELHVYYQYYKYTADEKFLEKTLLPRLKECEIVVRRWLREDKKGCLTLPLSSSPEINDNNLEAWLPSISTYDLALLRFLYTVLAELTRETEYGRILARLPAYPTDETGYQIYEGYPLTESHRCHAHMLQAYPLDLVDWSDDAQRDLVARSVENLEKYGCFWWVGFSFAWIADLYTRLGKGEDAVRHLNLLVKHLYSPNGFHLNGDQLKSGLTTYTYRPFTMETNMMFAEAVQEMLMQCYDGVIRIFPAVPEAWLQNCSFDGFLAYGNVKVSAAAKNGKVKRVELCSRKDGEVKILNPFSGHVESYRLHCGERVILEQ